MAILEIDSIQKSHQNKSVLSDVYLKCCTGEIIGLLGSNGSGKSTLLKIIFGIESAEYKFVRVDNAVKKKPEDLFKEISYLSQDAFLPMNFSVKKAIRLSISKENFIKFLNDDFLKEIIDKKIRDLSGGELRYLEILLVLNNTSKFVLLDEPYTGLSPIMIEKINNLIAINATNKGIIVSDHSYDNVLKISSRLIVLKNGKTHVITNNKQLFELGYLSKTHLDTF